MPAKKPQADTKEGPQSQSSRAVPASAGGGEARLYNAHKQGLPELDPTPPEATIASCEWWLVHFPSRRWRALTGDRQEGMRLLAKLGRGEDENGLLPPRAAAAGKKKGRAPAGTGAGAKAKAGEKGTAKAPKRVVTAVPPNADFDQAMQHVFPVARITEHFERLLTAEEDIFNKDGNCTGSKPAYTVQFQTLKALTEWHQGRPGEKPKKKDNRPVVSLHELRNKMLISPEYLDAMSEMIEDVKKQKLALVRAKEGASNAP